MQSEKTENRIHHLYHDQNKLNGLEDTVRCQSFSNGTVDLASVHLLAVVEIRPPGVQMLPFFSITEVTTKVQREGYIGFIIEMIFNMF